MNFKKYHVSKNLWDEEYPNISPTIKYVPLYVGEGSFTLSSTTPLPPNGAACLFFFSGSVDSGAGPQNRVYHENPRTVDSIDGYVTIAYRITSYDARDYTTMLNSGSTPLPYEPYSSEVWHDIPHYIHNTSTDTITTLPANIYPNDTIATVGLKGQTTQSSIPSSTSPVMPQGTGERTGNLIRFTNTTSTSGGGALIRQTADKSEIVIISRTATEADGSVTLDILAELSAGTYTLSVDGIIDRGSRNVDRIFIRDKDNNVIVNNVQTGKPNQFTISEDAKITKLSIVFAAVAEYNNQVVRIMLNSGSTALPYEPYGYKIPISSANTTTPVYLGDVQTTRKIKKLVLSSSQNWKLQSINSHGIANFYITVVNDFLDIASVISNFFTRQTTAIAGTTTEGMLIALSAATATIYIRINSQTASTAQGFKDWLDSLSDEVDIWYVLATEETAVVNEPLMRIGDYADTLSNVSIPVIAGGDTISVDTTVQPSEVTATYKGWHPVADVHERESNYTIATMQALTIAQLQTHTISELQGGEWS